MTREEAIEVICKNWPDDRYTSLRESLKTLIPELHKSEDERIRKELVAFFIEARNREGDKGYWHDLKVADILAYLEKQKEQNPAEWSEEDADMLNCCISSIEETKENRYAYKETDGDTSYDREIDWLKSLSPQPHRKLSEQEKGALRTAIHVLTEERNFPKTASHLQVILNSFD